ncbi:calcium-binding protein [Streptomyces populi]|uniref:Calcium-binding protein n=1 Tax=Streptomyces populi TaxID=2058924 RepID=A0A2I0SQ42_9ACTN|nr:calcium-binding protein [Streptomyces populi]PKT72061.1 calcium-binding protein [Streptomyces populi]
MHIRTAAAATAGSLALLSLLATTAQADTHKGDIAFTSVTFSRTTVNVGIGETQKLTASATLKDNSGIRTVMGFKLVSPDNRLQYAKSSTCTRPSSTTMKCTWSYSLDPRTDDYFDLRNSSAGTWHLDVEAGAYDGDFYTLDSSVTMKIKRYAKLATTRATPEPVAKGKTLTVTGALTRADWNTNTYVGFAGQKVALQFKRSGSSAYTTVKTVTTDSAGKLRTTATANASGTWRWHFAGTGTTSPATAAGDGVALK